MLVQKSTYIRSYYTEGDRKKVAFLIPSGLLVVAANSIGYPNRGATRPGQDTPGPLKTWLCHRNASGDLVQHNPV